MTAALVAGHIEDVDLAEGVGLKELRQELRHLHILLLGVQADVEDVLSPARTPASGLDLARSVKRTRAHLDALRERLEGASLGPTEAIQNPSG